MIEKRLMSSSELSVYLAIPKATIYTMVSLGKIPAACIKRIGRSLKFERIAIDEWVNRGASMQEPVQSA